MQGATAYEKKPVAPIRAVDDDGIAVYSPR
jgi:hypothetical protein